MNIQGSVSHTIGSIGEKRSLSTWFQEGEDPALYKLAFLITGAQALLLCSILLLYYNWLMLESCIVPFFWAAAISICLRGPKDGMLKLLDAASANATRSQNTERTKKKKNEEKKKTMKGRSNPVGDIIASLVSSVALYFHHRFLKLKFLLSSIASSLYIHPIFSFFSLSVFLFFSGPVITLFAFLVSVIFLSLSIICDKSYHNTIVTLYVLLGSLATVIVLGNFLGTVLVRELVQFFRWCKDLSTDPKLIQLLSDYGFTQDQLLSRIESLWEIADVQLQDRGYNLTSFASALNSPQNGTDSALSSLNQFDLNNIYGSYDLSDLYSASMTLSETVNLRVVQTATKEVFGVVFGSGVAFISQVASISSSIFNFLTGIVVFFTSLYYLLYSTFSIIENVPFLPVTADQRRKVGKKLQKSIKQVFTSTILILLTHSIGNFITWRIMDLEYAYSAAVLSGLMAIFPFFPIWLVYIPPVISLFVQDHPNFYSFLIVVLCVYVALVNIRSAIYELIPQSHAYLSGLSMVFGFTTFGIEGVVIGPLLIVLTVTIYEIFAQLSK